MLRVDAISVVEGLGEFGGVAWRGGFAVAEHGDEDHVVVVEALAGLGEGKGVIYEAAEAGWDEDFLGGRRVDGAVC